MASEHFFDILLVVSFYYYRDEHMDQITCSNGRGIRGFNRIWLSCKKKYKAILKEY
jgi:hypothetical protein